MDIVDEAKELIPWLEEESLIERMAKEIERLREALRDQFAMAALTGLLSDPSIDQLAPDEYAADSYLIADKMMEARERK